MRLGEVMVNYIEAAVELGTVGGLAVTQADFDKTINKLRTRTFNGKRLPNVTLAGNSLSVNGIIIDDPDRDPSVESIVVGGSSRTSHRMHDGRQAEYRFAQMEEI